MQGNVNLTTNENDIVVVLGNESRVSENYSDFLSSVKYVHSDLNDLQHSYIRLGFHLHEIKKYNYYQHFGYWNFYHFCADNFGLDRSTVSRLLDVSCTFCMRHQDKPHLQTMFIDEKYKDYSYSQLCEMIPLSSDQRKQIKPNMTVKQIRELKKQLKKKNVSSNVSNDGRTIIPIFAESVWIDLTNCIQKFFTGKGYILSMKIFSGGICKKFQFTCDGKDYEILFRVRQQK
ncbi:MAG: hypothetical protein ACI4PR_05655 [Acutalibacteraceae bacterium]